MKTFDIDFETFDSSILMGVNIIYGAGFNGKKLLEKLKQYNVSVDAFYDDDPSRGGVYMKV